jgi:hypothetical protein
MPVGELITVVNKSGKVVKSVSAHVATMLLYFGYLR